MTLDTVSLTFDALNRMVEQNSGGSYTEIAYAPTGEKLALMSGQSLQKAFVPLPGGAAAVYTSSGLDPVSLRATEESASEVFAAARACHWSAPQRWSRQRHTTVAAVWTRADAGSAFASAGARGKWPARSCPAFQRGKSHAG